MVKMFFGGKTALFSLPFFRKEINTKAMTRRAIIKILIIAGILIFVLFMAYVLLRDLRDWQNNINGFTKKYNSYADMVLSCEKGAFLISILLGLIPVGIAGILHWTDPYS